MSIILFDEDCLLCNRSVQFVLKHDKKNQFKIGALQSDMGKKMLDKFQFQDENLSTFVLLKDNEILVKSDAALSILSELGGIYSMAKIFKNIPRRLRDAVYLFISKNRYNWFGKTDHCIIMDEEWKDRMI